MSVRTDSVGKLFIVATPIGNLSDITLRAVETLKSVDFIAAEDTRTSSVLLKHFGISKPMISFHSHSRINRTMEIVGKISEGATAALITDAGTPGISDPGYLLVRAAIEAGHRGHLNPRRHGLCRGSVIEWAQDGQVCFRRFSADEEREADEASTTFIGNENHHFLRIAPQDRENTCTT